jgi:hypothetical protein
MIKLVLHTGDIHVYSNIRFEDITGASKEAIKSMLLSEIILNGDENGITEKKLDRLYNEAMLY